MFIKICHFNFIDFSIVPQTKSPDNRISEVICKLLNLAIFIVDIIGRILQSTKYILQTKSPFLVQLTTELLKYYISFRLINHAHGCTVLPTDRRWPGA